MALKSARKAHNLLSKFWVTMHAYKIHIWVWTVFITYETIIIGILYNLFGNPLTYLLHYLVIIPLFYLHSDFAMPWAFQKVIALRLPLIVVIQISFYILAHYTADLILIAIQIVKVNKPYLLNHDFILRNLYRGIFFMGFSTGYYFLKTYLNEKQKTIDLERQKLHALLVQKDIEQNLYQAQNAYLRAQIKPHFLFNSLNFIYNEVNTHSAVAASAILSLSDMMRFALSSEEGSEEILLGDEIQQVYNLISLTKMRKLDTFIDVFIEDKVKTLPFLPLIILTLVENMFKHGDLSDENRPGSLNVYMDDGLVIETSNLNAPSQSDRKSNGIANITSRLKYKYGELCEISHSLDSDQYFRLKIFVSNGSVLKKV